MLPPTASLSTQVSQALMCMFAPGSIILDGHLCPCLLAAVWEAQQKIREWHVDVVKMNVVQPRRPVPTAGPRSVVISNATAFWRGSQKQGDP